MKTSDEAAKLLHAIHGIAGVVQGHADEAERNRRLSRPVVSALADAGLFRMGLPADLGGLEVSPLTFYRAVEDARWAGRVVRFYRRLLGVRGRFPIERGGRRDLRPRFPGHYRRVGRPGRRGPRGVRGARPG